MKITEMLVKLKFKRYIYYKQYDISREKEKN